MRITLDFLGYDQFYRVIDIPHLDIGRVTRIVYNNYSNYFSDYLFQQQHFISCSERKEEATNDRISRYK
jgi:hypothetical protein